MKEVKDLIMGLAAAYFAFFVFALVIQGIIQLHEFEQRKRYQSSFLRIKNISPAIESLLKSFSSFNKILFAALSS